MVRDGHKVTLGTWYGLAGQPLPWTIAGREGQPAKSVTVLPAKNGSNYAIDTMVASYKHFKAEVLITISDVWVFPKDQTRMTNFCPWLPIDHDPPPKPVLEALEPAIYPMVYSRWGVEVLKEAGVKAHYVPCSAPAKQFTPGDKAKARVDLGFADDADFVVSIVAANKDPHDRKGFAEGLLGFARFLESRPNTYLYLHTDWSGAIDIPALVENLDIKDQVIKPDPYAYALGLLDAEYMTSVYRASDVLLNSCKSEGFGLPLVEAQMCGTPIIATDFATTDELMFAGWRLQGQPDWSNGLNSWRMRVNVDDVVSALEEAYHEKDNRKLAKKATNGARRYDNDTIFNQHWRPALKDIEELVSDEKNVFSLTENLDMVSVP
jgi:glycosyltransferase involved in cell wall biosynthesis